MIRISTIILLLIAPLVLSAKITLPELFSDNMVLQQQSKVGIWGKAEPNTRVSITTSWNKRLYTVVSDSKGNFRTALQTPSAGGPYNISLKTSSTLVLKNVLIGEVWVCSGQSNMGMTVNGGYNQPVLNSNDMLMDAENSQIRLFKVNISRSDTPLGTLANSSWKSASAASIKDFSVVAYGYAKILNKQLKVPVGVIMTTVGGTKIEAWMSKESLTDFPMKKIVQRKEGEKITSSNDPTVLFNAMINPLIGYGMKGVLWYQGEGNRADYAFYDKMMTAMVKDWRMKWGQGEWPFYYVQIAPWRYKSTESEMVPRFREAQERAMQLIPNSGMAVSIDAGDEVTIHPPNKEVIYKRLAYWSLANNYGKQGISYLSPSFKSMSVDKGAASILFDHAENGFTSFGQEISAFEIAGADGVFFPATVKLMPKGVVLLSSKEVKEPVNVRYAFKDWTVGNLYNTAGLPVAPFRTDKLPIQ